MPYLVGIYYKLSMHTAIVKFMVRSASIVPPHFLWFVFTIIHRSKRGLHHLDMVQL